jgi:hypothetical protein
MPEKDLSIAIYYLETNFLKRSGGACKFLKQRSTRGSSLERGKSPCRCRNRATLESMAKIGTRENDRLARQATRELAERGDVDRVLLLFQISE